MKHAGTYNCSPNVLAQEVNGEVVLLDLSGEVYLGMNAVASRIWALLKEGRGSGGILESLVQEFDAPQARIEADLAAFITQLSEAGIIEATTGEEGDA